MLPLFLIVILAECLLFQWAAFVPMPTAAMDIAAVNWAVEGFSRPSGSDRILTADSSGRHAVTVRLPQTAVRSLYLDAYSDRLGPLSYVASAVGDKSATPQDLATGEVATGVSRSRSLLLWPEGKVTQLRLEFELEAGQQLFLNRLVLNRKVPFSPDALRILLLLAVGLLLQALFRAPIFLRQAHPDDLNQRLVMIASGALVFILCLWLAIASASAPFFDVSQTSGDLYSRNLTDALLQGRFDLLTDPPPELAQLANPYDPAMRTGIPADSLIWDAAWFNGRYYVSYGVVPALLIFVPFHALSGYYFQTAWAVCLFGAFGLLLLFLNLRRLLLIHFPRLAFRWHFVACLTGCAACFAGWGLARPKFYELASLGGFFFLMLSASQLLRAAYGRRGAAHRSLVYVAAYAAQTESPQPLAPPPQAAATPTPPTFVPPGEPVTPLLPGEPIAPLPDERISASRLFLSSLFLMLAIGCQPVLAITLLTNAVALILLLRRARQSHQVLETLSFSILPLVIVGALLGAYNQARFGSMFEFGSQYRLTLADLRTATPNLARLLPGFGQHLLTPPVIDTIFPFVHFPAGQAFSPSTFFPDDGRTVGLLALPFLAILPLMPLLPRLRLAFHKSTRAVAGLITVSAATGLLILAHDSMTLGASGRNAIDFGVWLALAAVLAWLTLADSVDNLPFSPVIHKYQASYPRFGEKTVEKARFAAAIPHESPLGKTMSRLAAFVPMQAIAGCRKKRRPLPGAWFALFLTAAALTLMLCSALFLQGENDRIRTYAPQVYEQLRRTLAFWLP